MVIYMFVDKEYPLTVELMGRMLDHQLEIDEGTLGNELTTAVQLIMFIKQHIADANSCGGFIFVVDSKTTAFRDADKTILLDPIISRLFNKVK
ncbi:hypothetical protein Tco_1547655 [Tanacetum coccineum]